MHIYTHVYLPYTRQNTDLKYYGYFNFLMRKDVVKYQR
jgi:hypothetical protein